MPVLPAVPSTITPPGRSRPRRLGVGDDRQRGPVLDAAAGVQELALAEDLAAGQLRDALFRRTSGVLPIRSTKPERIPIVTVCIPSRALPGHVDSRDGASQAGRFPIAAALAARCADERPRARRDRRLPRPGRPSPAPVERVDTHAAMVFLEGDRAWKMKRAVAFSFLDFSTLERARAGVARRAAPEPAHRTHALSRACAR